MQLILVWFGIGYHSRYGKGVANLIWHQWRVVFYRKSHPSYNLIKTLKRQNFTFLKIYDFVFDELKVQTVFFWCYFCFCLLLNYASCPIARTCTVPTYPTPQLTPLSLALYLQNLRFRVWIIIILLMVMCNTKLF